MTETTNDEETFTVELTGDEEEPKKTPWILYLILAAIAAALLG